MIERKYLFKTDHNALEYLWSTQNTNSRLVRWALKLQEFDFDIKYIKGEENITDGLSRSLKICNSIRNITENYSQMEKIKYFRNTTLN